MAFQIWRNEEGSLGSEARMEETSYPTDDVEQVGYIYPIHTASFDIII
jgi:hypothetical protein